MLVQPDLRSKEIRKLQSSYLYLVYILMSFAKQEGNINLEAKEALVQCISAYKEVNFNYLHASFSCEQCILHTLNLLHELFIIGS